MILYRRAVFWRVLTIIAIGAVGLACGGCASAPRLTPNGEARLPADTSGARVRATVKTMNEVIVELPALAEPGDEWMIALNDSRYFKQLRPIEVLPNGVPVARFLALKPGRRPIRFFASPPRQREVAPHQIYEIVITIE